MSVAALYLLANIIAGLICALIAWTLWQEGDVGAIVRSLVAIVVVRWWLVWAVRSAFEFVQARAIDFATLEPSIRALHIGIFAVIVTAGILSGVVSNQRKDAPK